MFELETRARPRRRGKPPVTLVLRWSAPPPAGALVVEIAPLEVDAAAWLAGDVDSWQLDERVDALASASALSLRLVGGRQQVIAAAAALLRRCQRWSGRRNAGSGTAWFNVQLRRHRALHDLRQPLQAADWRHALDTWQWVLRLQRQATLAVQLAALFHDVERLMEAKRTPVEAPADAASYGAFKAAHARRGAEIAHRLLSAGGLPGVTARRVAALVACHEDGGADAETKLLAEADALSFFSLNADGYLHAFGPARTRDKMAWTRARLGPRGLRRLAMLRLRPAVAALVAESAAAAAAPVAAPIAAPTGAPA